MGSIDKIGIHGLDMKYKHSYPTMFFDVFTTSLDRPSYVSDALDISSDAQNVLYLLRKIVIIIIFIYQAS